MHYVWGTMTATSKCNRGNKLWYDCAGEVWRYVVNNDIANYELPCVRCGQLPTVEGYDYCLGHIKGAKHACCGHGVKKPYIIWENDDEQV